MTSQTNPKTAKTTKAKTPKAQIPNPKTAKTPSPKTAKTPSEKVSPNALTPTQLVAYTPASKKAHQIDPEKFVSTYLDCTNKQGVADFQSSRIYGTLILTDVRLEPQFYDDLKTAKVLKTRKCEGLDNPVAKKFKQMLEKYNKRKIKGKPNPDLPEHIQAWLDYEPLYAWIRDYMFFEMTIYHIESKDLLVYAFTQNQTKLDDNLLFEKDKKTQTQYIFVNKSKQNKFPYQFLMTFSQTKQNKFLDRQTLVQTFKTIYRKTPKNVVEKLFDGSITVKSDMLIDTPIFSFFDMGENQPAFLQSFWDNTDKSENFIYATKYLYNDEVMEGDEADNWSDTSLDIEYYFECSGGKDCYENHITKVEVKNGNETIEITVRKDRLKLFDLKENQKHKPSITYSVLTHNIYNCYDFLKENQERFIFEANKGRYDFESNFYGLGVFQYRSLHDLLKLKVSENERVFSEFVEQNPIPYTLIKLKEALSFSKKESAYKHYASQFHRAYARQFLGLVGDNGIFLTYENQNIIKGYEHLNIVDDKQLKMIKKYRALVFKLSPRKENNLTKILEYVKTHQVYDEKEFLRLLVVLYTHQYMVNLDRTSKSKDYMPTAVKLVKPILPKMTYKPLTIKQLKTYTNQLAKSSQFPTRLHAKFLAQFNLTSLKSTPIDNSGTIERNKDTFLMELLLNFVQGNGLTREQLPFGAYKFNDKLELFAKINAMWLPKSPNFKREMLTMWGKFPSRKEQSDKFKSYQDYLQFLLQLISGNNSSSFLMFLKNETEIKELGKSVDTFFKLERDTYNDTPAFFMGFLSGVKGYTLGNLHSDDKEFHERVVQIKGFVENRKSSKYKEFLNEPKNKELKTRYDDLIANQYHAVDLIELAGEALFELPENQSICQLRTNDDFSKETEKMNHCISLYYHSSVEGYYFIFHIVSDDNHSTLAVKYNSSRSCWVDVEHKSEFNEYPAKSNIVLADKLITWLNKNVLLTSPNTNKKTPKGLQMQKALNSLDKTRQEIKWINEYFERNSVFLDYDDMKAVSEQFPNLVLLKNLVKHRAGVLKRYDDYRKVKVDEVADKF